MKKMTLPITGTVYLLLLFPFFMQDDCPPPPPTSPDTVYVDAVNGNDATGQRGNKDRPFKTIMRAIHRAEADGDTILVLEGSYYEKISISSKSLIVKSESGPYKTIIHGTEIEGSGYVVSIKTDSSTFQGFTVLVGESTFGGIFTNSLDTKICNNIITGHDFGISITRSSNPLIENNVVYSNYNGIIYWQNAEPTIIHNTIVFNRHAGISVNSGKGLIENNIVYSNKRYGIFFEGAESSLKISHNNVFGNLRTNYFGCSSGEGAISSNPMFINSGLNDFQLSDTSPCISAAKIDENTPDIDFEYMSRPNPPYSCPDIGAYEHTAGNGDFLLTISESIGGTTTPLPDTYNCCEGTVIGVEAFPNEYYIFLEWTGDFLLENKENKYLNFTMDFNKSIIANFKLIHPPLNIAGQKNSNRSLTQIEYINVLTWQPNPNNDNLEAHYIYLTEGGQMELITKVSAGVYDFMHRKVDQNKTYTYSVVAIIGDREGIPAYVTVK